MTESAPIFALDEAGELNLYSLQEFLFQVQYNLNTTPSKARADVAESLRYLEDKEAVRAVLVRRCLSMAASLVSEAATIINDGIDWPTVEALFCLNDEEFLDTPQQWLATAQAEAEREQQRQQEHKNGASAPLEANGTPTAPEIAPEVSSDSAAPLPPKLAELVNEGLSLPTPRRAALRSLGRSLRDEREREMRRFYAIAQKHGLVTGSHAGDAIRAALSELFETPIASRKELTASQWSQAASALETEDLFWQVKTPPKAPKAARNGAGNGGHNGQLNGTHNGHSNGAQNGHAPALHL